MDGYASLRNHDDPRPRTGRRDGQLRFVRIIHNGMSTKVQEIIYLTACYTLIRTNGYLSNIGNLRSFTYIK